MAAKHSTSHWPELRKAGPSLCEAGRVLKLLMCQLLPLAHCPPLETSQDISQAVEVCEGGKGKIKGVARLVSRMWHGGGCHC